VWSYSGQELTRVGESLRLLITAPAGSRQNACVLAAARISRESDRAGAYAVVTYSRARAVAPAAR
jgi:hypothetical protein